MMSAQEVIDQDGIYEDGESRFQYRKGTVLPPGRKAILKRVGDYPVAEIPGAAEMAATETTPEEVAKAEADAKAKADAKPSNKKDSAPENKSA